MVGLTYTSATALLLCALPFGSATPVRRAFCDQPYQQYDEAVQGTYIVAFADGYTLDKHFEFLKDNHNIDKFKFTELSDGYYADVSSDVLKAIRTDCSVESVEDDVYGSVPADDETAGAAGAKMLAKRGSQKDAPWPLFQLSSRVKDSSGTDRTYYHVDDAGKGVDIYIIDTGIQHPQDEFDNDGTDRVVFDINCSDEPNNDDNYVDSSSGHGTKVASAAAGKGQGVAKSANLINVKFFREGKANAAFLSKALDEILARHESRKGQTDFKGSVINMSFHLPRTNSVSTKLSRAWTAGISLVAASGNNGYQPDAFPQSHPRVISVGASKSDYTPMADDKLQSNYGKDVIDLWAPGYKVPICDKNKLVSPRSGTSFAAPYVAGILAIFYGVEGPSSMSPQTAKDRMMKQTDDWATLPKDGTDWHDSPLSFANTGNRKGFAENPRRLYRDGPEIESSSSEEPGKCHVGVGFAINRVENNKQLVTMTLSTNEKDNVNSWSGEMSAGESKSVGGLGPVISWTLKENTASTFPFDLDMKYDVESWNWLGCEFMSDSDLGRGVKLQSRMCTFPCHG